MNRKMITISLKSPPNQYHEYIYIDIEGNYILQNGDDESGEPTRLIIWPDNNSVTIEFETNDVSVKERKFK